MSSASVIGVQWGDEGKGRIVDLLAPEYQRVVRYQGGANAGHTIQCGEETFKLHIIPAGILHSGVQSVIGNGVLVDLDVLFEEIDGLAARGVHVDGRLKVSDRAQIVMPYHKVLDGLREDSAKTSGTFFGTTRRGIGPCQSDKVSYHGLRVCDLEDFAAVEDRFRDEVALKNRVIRELHGAEPLDADILVERLRAQSERLRPFVADTITLLHEGLAAGDRHLYEGAQGALLDVDFGTYPFVTATNASTAGVWTGTGVPPGHITRIIGVMKAYQTKVGEGPFPTEVSDVTVEHLQGRGREVGTTTGRPRRCGWLDLVSVKHAARVNGLTEFALTKLDVLSGLERIRVATAYEIDGRETTAFPASPAVLARAVPKYVEFDGWEDEITEVRAFGDLPDAARTYVDALDSLAGVPVLMVSVGPERHQLIRRGG